MNCTTADRPSESDDGQWCSDTRKSNDSFRALVDEHLSS